MSKLASMKAIIKLLINLALTLYATHLVAGENRTVFAYPPSERQAQTDVLHGTRVADPYRWLEDDNAEATKLWVEAQNKLTFSYLEGIAPRAAIRQRVTELWNYEKFGVPSKHGEYYVYAHNNGLQNQSVIFIMRGLDGEPRLLLDPNTLSPDGTVALATYSISEDGNYMAYGLSDGGSDWRTIHVRDIGTGKDLPDKIEWMKFSDIAWRKDNQGFYYSRYDAPKQGDKLKGSNYFHKLYYHKLGTEQHQDVLVYEDRAHKRRGFDGKVSEDGHYLIIQVWEGTENKNRVYYKDLRADASPVIKLLDAFDAEYEFVGNDGPLFWFRTDNAAPRYRLIGVDIRKPSREHWRELIAQDADTLRGVSVVDDRFIADYMHDAHARVKLFQLDGAPAGDVVLPGIGSVTGFEGKRTGKESFYSFSGFSSPSVIYRYDIAANKSQVFRRPSLKFAPDDYVTRQVFYKSKDGTRIPMFVSHKKGLKLTGATPTLLYGYGGFNISLMPRFRIANLAWMEMGGVFAQPNLRGGGEYGKDWHDAGRLHNKQNVFDDFIAAAQWLVTEGYTRADKLAIHGGSNGGLLVGAAITQRPELFAAALPAVGVMDMLRFHKFTIGWAWTSDYGSPEEADFFKTLYKYSPYHNLKPGTAYPATLVTTGDHDDRVVPAHSFKFAAALQAAQSGAAPVMIRVETRAGHGAGKPTQYAIEEVADQWAFLVKNLAMDVKP